MNWLSLSLAGSTKLWNVKQHSPWPLIICLRLVAWFTRSIPERQLTFIWWNLFLCLHSFVIFNHIYFWFWFFFHPPPLLFYSFIVASLLYSFSISWFTLFEEVGRKFSHRILMDNVCMNLYWKYKNWAPINIVCITVLLKGALYE